MVKIQNVWETKYTSSEIKEKSLQRKETSVIFIYAIRFYNKSEKPLWWMT